MTSVKRLLILAFATVLPLVAGAGNNEMTNVKLTSCREDVCTKLVTPTLYRSNLQPNLMVFNSAKMVLVSVKNKDKELIQFEAEDGYYDSEDQIIVMRNLKKSKHKELIYNMVDGKFLFF